MWFTWHQLVNHYRTMAGVNATLVESWAYYLHGMDVMVILLGESGKLLNWKKVWALPDPVEHLCHA
jgi:hypothetical protein